VQLVFLLVFKNPFRYPRNIRCDAQKFSFHGLNTLLAWFPWYTDTWNTCFPKETITFGPNFFHRRILLPARTYPRRREQPRFLAPYPRKLSRALARKNWSLVESRDPGIWTLLSWRGDDWRVPLAGEKDRAPPVEEPRPCRRGRGRGTSTACREEPRPCRRAARAVRATLPAPPCPRCATRRCCGEHQIQVCLLLPSVIFYSISSPTQLLTDDRQFRSTHDRRRPHPPGSCGVLAVAWPSATVGNVIALARRHRRTWISVADSTTLCRLT
jgi:hypothetical protein